MSNLIFPLKMCYHVGDISYQKCDIQCVSGMTKNTTFNFVTKNRATFFLKKHKVF